MFSADRIGTEVTEEDLQALKQLLTCDYRNFRGKDNKISFGFTSAIAEVIVERADTLVSKDAKICALNDLSLEMYLTLLKAGYKRENIYIAVGNWTEAKGKAVPDTERNTTLLFHHHVSTSFVEDINIISLEEFLTMTFDLIIANPPYGAIGANITKTIIDNVQFDYYINLLPANDYKRNSTKDLYNYQSDMEPINDGFKGDAAVTTHLARVHKAKVNTLTLEEFERSQYTDGQLDKYFAENSKRTHYAISTSTATAPKDINFDSSLSIMFNHRTAANKHLAYSKDTAPYSINNNLLTYAQAAKTYGLKNDKSKRLFDAGFVHFKSLVEKQNIVSFMYSVSGFKFISKVLSATNTDSWLDIDKFLPKVDWTRTWTVEEILADYGYTVEEIAEVMTDLENFKDMERD
jgi:hypothetical protein